MSMTKALIEQVIDTALRGKRTGADKSKRCASDIHRVLTHDESDEHGVKAELGSYFHSVTNEAERQALAAKIVKQWNAGNTMVGPAPGGGAKQTKNPGAAGAGNTSGGAVMRAVKGVLAGLVILVILGGFGYGAYWFHDRVDDLETTVNGAPSTDTEPAGIGLAEKVASMQKQIDGDPKGADKAARWGLAKTLENTDFRSKKNKKAIFGDKDSKDEKKKMGLAKRVEANETAIETLQVDVKAIKAEMKNVKNWRRYIDSILLNSCCRHSRREVKKERKLKRLWTEGEGYTFSYKLVCVPLDYSWQDKSDAKQKEQCGDEYWREGLVHRLTGASSAIRVMKEMAKKSEKEYEKRLAELKGQYEKVKRKVAQLKRLRKAEKKRLRLVKTEITVGRGSKLVGLEVTYPGSIAKKKAPPASGKRLAHRSPRP